jgi:hypothetical protein
MERSISVTSFNGSNIQKDYADDDYDMTYRGTDVNERWLYF